MHHGYMDSYHVLLLFLFIVAVVVIVIVVFYINKSSKELSKDAVDVTPDLSFKQPEISIDSDDSITIKETVAKLTSRLMKKKNTSKNYAPVNDDNTTERSSFTHDSFGSNNRHNNKSFGSFMSNKSCRTSLSTVDSNSNESFSSYYIDYSSSIKTKCDTV
jgi:ABC-type lipoprotein release transport system permease subunit